MERILAGLLLATAVGASAAPPAQTETGVAVVKGTAEGSPVGGTVTFLETKEGLKVTAKLTGLPPGVHAFHIHQFGSCADAGKAAGSHYNPMSSPHGFLPKDGMKKAHGGDMGNITAAADGTATLEIVLHHIALSNGKFNVGGRAVIVHEKTDDFSQPVGNAGGRIGCGIISVTGQ